MNGGPPAPSLTVLTELVLNPPPFLSLLFVPLPSLFLPLLIAGRRHLGNHAGSECAIAAGAHSEPVGAGASSATGSGPLPPG